MEKIYFSPSTDSFYFESLNGSQIPSDVITIVAEKYDTLMAGIAQGKFLTHDSDGNPILVDQPSLPVPALIEICKANAKSKLADTDWSQTADVGELLINQPEFTAYRAELRSIYFNPVPNPVWPVEPVAQWR